MDSKVAKEVQEYYGKTLQSTRDLKTNACCPTGTKPAKYLTVISLLRCLFLLFHVKKTILKQEILKKIHPEVLDRFYGCGSPIPAHLSGCTVVDLGSGVGRDSFLM